MTQPKEQSYPACGERRNLETRPKTTIVLDERGEPVDKPRLAESMASATDDNADFSVDSPVARLDELRDTVTMLWSEDWTLEQKKGYVKARVAELEHAVAESSNPGNGVQKERLLDTTYGDEKIIKANS